MVLSKPEIKIEIREGARTEYGYPEPVARVVFADIHWRAAKATMLRLAAEIEMLSIDQPFGVASDFSIEILGAHENHAYSVGVIKLSLDQGTHAEAVRGEEVLHEAVNRLEKSEWFRCLYQGGRVSEPTWKQPRRFGRRSGVL